MPEVWIPSLLRELTGGQRTVAAAGTTVREVIDSLEQSYPGIKARLLEDDALRPGLTLVVDGKISRLKLRQTVEETSEIHFVPAISGG